MIITKKTFIIGLISLCLVIGGLAPAFAQTRNYSDIFAGLSNKWQRITINNALVGYDEDSASFLVNDWSYMMFVPRHYDGMPFDKSEIINADQPYFRNGQPDVDLLSSIWKAQEIVYWQHRENSSIIIIQNLVLPPPK